MIKKLPFEIISEKGDQDWIDAIPITHQVEYHDFLADEETRNNTETIAKSGGMVLVKNGNELLGAIMPRTMLMIHQLLIGDNTDGFFDLINNRVFKSQIGGNEGAELLEKCDADNQACIVFNNAMEPLYGFANADFIKENLTTDGNAKCMFKNDLSDRIVHGIRSWDDRMDEAMDRLESARINIDAKAQEADTRFDIVLKMQGSVDKFTNFIYGIDIQIKIDAKQIFSLMSLEKTTDKISSQELSNESL